MHVKKFSKFIEQNAGKLVVCIIIALVMLCTAIKSSKFDNDINSWVERNAQVDLDYIDKALGEGHGSTQQLLIQTPLKNNPHQDSNNKNKESVNILDSKSLLMHLDAMTIAIAATVDMFDVTWSLKDLCYTPEVPEIDNIHLDLALEKFIPCAIKTPLDCFWEGSKLLGPEIEIPPFNFKVKWTSLNPIHMVEAMQQAVPHGSVSYQTIKDWMKNIGMTTGYQYKPCLDPTDPLCPSTAPNKNSPLDSLDIGAQLTGGCYGLATRGMHWREEEIVGGVEKNRSNFIVHASGLQSTIQLMGEGDMYQFWKRHQRAHEINNWSPKKSKMILDAWQAKFKEELDLYLNKSTQIRTTKLDVITSSSSFESLNVSSLDSLFSLEVCFVLMTLFACIFFPHLQARDISYRFGPQVLALAASSVIGLVFSASLGLISLLDLPVNAATTQILPSLALFYGFNQLFIIAHSFSIHSSTTLYRDLCTTCIRDFGPVLIVESFLYCSVLTTVTFLPIVATKVFAFQAISYIVLSTLTSLLLLPCLFFLFLEEIAESPTLKSSYAYKKLFIKSSKAQFFSCMITLIAFSYLASFSAKVKFGLEITDIISRDSPEYDALNSRQKYFPNYNMYAITKAPFDYPSNQRLLYEYVDKISRVEGVVSTAQRPQFWLESFRNWLQDLQHRFDFERNQSLIWNDGWKPEASDMARLAYKLLVQTGRSDKPIDKNQIEYARLVDNHGIINQKAFYYYLTAWVMNDPFSYAISEASFKPEPRHWTEKQEDLRIEKAKPLTYAQIPFLLKLDHNVDKLKSISNIRSISRAFDQLNMPNFPTGIPFLFWEQYSHLEYFTCANMILCLVLIFIINGIVLTSFKISTMISIQAVILHLPLYGFFGLTGIPFSNILSVLFVFMVGLNASFIMQTFMSYLVLNEQDIQLRVSEAVGRTMKVKIDTTSLLMIVVVSLFMSQFDFIVRLSLMLLCSTFLNVVSLLVWTPVTLRVCGKASGHFFSCRDDEEETQASFEKTKSKSQESIDIPLALYYSQLNDQLKYKKTKGNKFHNKRKGYPKLPSSLTLSTISEESRVEAQSHQDLKFDLSIKCYK